VSGPILLAGANVDDHRTPRPDPSEQFLAGNGLQLVTRFQVRLDELIQLGETRFREPTYRAGHVVNLRVAEAVVDAQPLLARLHEPCPPEDL
jgi:hypothetical protein